MEDIQNIATLDNTILEEVRFYTKAAFPELVESFFESVDKHMSVLHNALQTDEYPDIGANAHALKSISGQLGGLKFSAIAARMENSAETPDHKTLSALYDALNDEFIKLKQALNDELNKT